MNNTYELNGKLITFEESNTYNSVNYGLESGTGVVNLTAILDRILTEEVEIKVERLDREYDAINDRDGYKITVLSDFKGTIYRDNSSKINGYIIVDEKVDTYDLDKVLWNNVGEQIKITISVNTNNNNVQS